MNNSNTNNKYLNPFFKKFYLALVLILIEIFGGIGGYIGFESYSLLDAFYMTILTISSVGYMEVVPLSDQGRIFTSILIIFNLGTLAYSLSIITSFILEGDLKHIYKKFKMQKAIDSLENHMIICGFGRNGQKVAEEFMEKKIPFVVIERNLTKSKNSLFDSILYIDGDATDENVLKQANIFKAHGLISTLPKDPDNVYVILSSKELNKNIFIISRASEESSQSKLRIAGANFIVIPELISGTHMAMLITQTLNHDSNLPESIDGLVNKMNYLLDNFKIQYQKKSNSESQLDVITSGSKIAALETLVKSFQNDLLQLNKDSLK